MLHKALTKKPNKGINYIHVSSDHLASIIKEIPQSIEKKLFNIVIIKKHFSGISHLL